MSGPRPGFVYVFARLDGSGDVKIGFSRDPDGRKTQVCPGQEWTVAATFAHHRPHLVELEAHRILQEFETDSEWFRVPKYIAFDAVSQAMHTIDQQSNWVPEIPPPQRPPPVPIEVSLKGTFKLPPPLPTTDDWVLGYVRRTQRVREAPQYQWLRASGVPPGRIYIERVVGGYPDMDLMLKDCREGDVVAVWAPDVFGPGARRIIDEIQARGASVAYAVKGKADA